MKAMAKVCFQATHIQVQIFICLIQHAGFLNLAAYFHKKFLERSKTISFKSTYNNA